MKNLLGAAILTLLMGGCVSSQPFSVSDKTASMEPYVGMKLHNVSGYPEGFSDQTESNAEIAAYLAIRSAIVLSKDDLEMADWNNVENEINYGANGELAVVQINVVLGENTSLGQAALISSDGYFTTAAHVVDSPQSRIAFHIVDLEKQKIELKIVPFRKVLIDSEADFAIIKAELASSYYLNVAESHVPQGDRIFCGGWINGGISSGVLNKIEEMESNLIGKYRRIESTAPVMKGDSGSAAINEYGRFIGVMTRAGLRGLRSGVEKFSILIMPTPEKINEIIENDRKQVNANQSELAIGSTHSARSNDTSL